MLIVFFDAKGVVHKEFVPAGNAAYYKTVLERLRQRVQRVRTDIAYKRVLHHDNAPAHTALLVCEFLAKVRVATLPHPPYSPDLAPVDFFVSQGENGSQVNVTPHGFISFNVALKSIDSNSVYQLVAVLFIAPDKFS